MEGPDGRQPACDSCELGRRAFVVAAAEAAALFLGIGLSPSLARAIPLDARSVRDSARAEERRYAVPAADGVSIDEDASVILARRGDAVYAFSLACPHKQTALRWQQAAGQFVCPKHKSRYQPDGVFISGRATRSMDRYSVRRDGTAIVVDLAQLHREDRDRAAWQAAFVRV